jgi:hypothetical protein
VNGEISKFITEEHVRAAILRFHGDLKKVSEATGVPLEYAQRIQVKLKRQRKYNISTDVASNVSETILSSYEEIMERYRQMLGELLDVPLDERSPCCMARVNDWLWEGQLHLTCSMCGKEFGIPRKIERNYGEINRILANMAKLNDTLTNFADKMGYTFKPSESGEGIKIGVSINNNPSPKHLNQLTVEDQKIIEEAKKLDGQARGVMIKSIESKILEATFETDEGQIPTPELDPEPGPGLEGIEGEDEESQPGQGQGVS